MGIFDKARDAPTGRTDRLDPHLDRTAEETGRRVTAGNGATTGRAGDVAEGARGDQDGGDTAPEPVSPA